MLFVSMPFNLYHLCGQDFCKDFSSACFRTSWDTIFWLKERHILFKKSVKLHRTFFFFDVFIVLQRNIIIIVKSHCKSFNLLIFKLMTFINNWKEWNSSSLTVLYLSIIKVRRTIEYELPTLEIERSLYGDTGFKKKKKNIFKSIKNHKL